MTRDEAIEAVKEYQKSMSTLTVLISLESIRFGAFGPAIEKALGLQGVLFTQLPAKEMTQMFSNYLSVLQNAIDGKLVASTNEEWSEVIDAE